jgi:DNA-binding CsgD family transcriptional regulator
MSIMIEVEQPAVSAPLLSSFEKICLTMIAEGRPLPEIGLLLGVPAFIVENLLSDSERKLGAHNRLHAVSLAMLRGHLDYGNAKPE